MRVKANKKWKWEGRQNKQQGGNNYTYPYR